MHSKIIGTGSYLPAKVLTNFDLEKIVDTSHDWIVSRSGIVERHIADDKELTSDLALQASLRAIEAAGISADEIDLVIVATTTPDQVFPSTACILQDKLGIKNRGAAFDMQAVCGGFVYAMNTADLYIRGGQSQDCTGGRCGSAVAHPGLERSHHLRIVRRRSGCSSVACLRKSRCHHGEAACRWQSSRHACKAEGNIRNGEVQGDAFIKMEGQAVFKFAVKVLSDVVEEVLAENRLQGSDIDWLVPHQANIRIMEATAKKLGLSMDNVIVTVATHGNTSAASIPLALDTAVRDGRIKTGQNIILEAVGGGFTWGAVLIKW